ncbi:uncharacterized protein VTP21DRAFT_1018 [Calcarisporiella thermophila]|uniref:uncharacterized protein n=1 Tax=Calcarisporiella thermophila TaxID=911321 RepID=UPI0037444190
MEKSLKTEVITLIDEYAAQVRNLFTSLSKVAEGKTLQPEEMPSEVMGQVVDVDNRMQAILNRVEEHQAVQQKLERTRQDIELQHSTILRIMKQLYESQKQLNLYLDSTKHRIDSIKQAEESEVTYEDIIVYARKISKYTSAPLNFEQNPNLANPPYPQDTEMRMGLLFRSQHGDLTAEQEHMLEEEESDVSSVDLATAHAKKEAQPSQASIFDLDLNP